MKRLLATLIGLAALAAAAALVIPTLASGSVKHATAKVAPQQLTLYIFRGKEGIPGAADGKGHDTMVPSTFALKAGVPVQITVYNYDEGPHTITAPDLGLNILIKPGTQFDPNTPPAGATPTELVNQVVPGVTRFTFTPKKAGVFRWHCALPCDAGQQGWAMQADTTGPAKLDFMAGYIVVVA